MRRESNQLEEIKREVLEEARETVRAAQGSVSRSVNGRGVARCIDVGRGTYFLKEEGFLKERGSTSLLVGHGSSWSLNEVRTFSVEPKSARGSLERKQVSSTINGFFRDG